jgi:hypothetical protein
MSKEKIVVHLSKSMLTLTFDFFDDDVDVDDLTRIHYHNIFGEVVTVSTLLNKIGLIRAEAEESYEQKKLERVIYEAETSKRLRRESVENGGKIKVPGSNGGGDVLIKATDTSIESAIVLDPGYQIKKKNEIKAWRDFQYVDSLYWAIKSKDTKLNNLMKEVKPEDFLSQIVEEKINGILIKKIPYKNI